jgi:hypothetical protein
LFLRVNKIKPTQLLEFIQINLGKKTRRKEDSVGHWRGWRVEGRERRGRKRKGEGKARGQERGYFPLIEVAAQ